MGMYTTIFDPKTNTSAQIKCGYDRCETYSVGDTVVFGGWPRRAGECYLADGVYGGIGDGPDFRDYWIVIADHVVRAMTEWKDEPRDIKTIREDYDIQDPDPGLWTQEEWDAKAARDAEAKKRQEAYAASVAHLSPEERFAHASTSRRRGMLQRDSWARQVLPPIEQDTP